MHFVRALREKKLEAEGFNLRKLYRLPNPNRPTEEEITAAREAIRQAGGAIHVNESVSNVLTRARQPKLIETLDIAKVPYEDYIKLEADGTKLAFKNFLQVVYTGEKEEWAYTYYTSPFKKRVPSFQTSVISLKGDYVWLEENGAVTDPLDLLFEGYWGFEKIGDMLPLDYKM